MSKYKETFSLFDKDGDGTIPTKDLGVALKMLGKNLTEHELGNLLDEMDINRKGPIELDEFLALMASSGHSQYSEEEFLEAFRVFDKNGNGLVSVAVLRHVMKELGGKLSDEEIDGMIREPDVDGDGNINYEEFVKMMMARSS